MSHYSELSGVHRSCHFKNHIVPHKIYHCQINTWALLWVFCWFITIICCPVDVCSIWWPLVLGVAFDGGEEPCWSIFLLCKNKAASMNRSTIIERQDSQTHWICLEKGYTSLLSYVSSSDNWYWTQCGEIFKFILAAATWLDKLRDLKSAPHWVQNLIGWNQFGP